ncbi:hypothetical protein KCU61_g710, partial [Aureobasidium melanogenum]
MVNSLPFALSAFTIGRGVRLYCPVVMVHWRGWNRRRPTLSSRPTHESESKRDVEEIKKSPGGSATLSFGSAKEATNGFASWPQE